MRKAQPQSGGARKPGTAVPGKSEEEPESASAHSRPHARNYRDSRGGESHAAEFYSACGFEVIGAAETRVGPGSCCGSWCEYMGSVPSVPDFFPDFLEGPPARGSGLYPLRRQISAARQVDTCTLYQFFAPVVQRTRIVGLHPTDAGSTPERRTI
jgi:hypothetical protein